MNFDKNKPSLNSLFESKKLDLPKTQFWDQFQNEVKGKVVASASRPNLSQRFAKISTIIVPVFLLSILYIQNFLGGPNFSVPDERSVRRQAIDEFSLRTKLEKDKSLSILQNLEESQYDVLLSSIVFEKGNSESTTFVEKSLKLDQTDSFETQFLNNFEYRQDDVFAQYTF